MGSGDIQDRAVFRAARGARLRREVGEIPTLLHSGPACKEGSYMDPTRLLHAPHLLAPDSQNTCRKTQ